MEIEDGILLLLSSKKPILSVKEAVEIIELVTKNPENIKKTIKVAEDRGLIKREGLVLTVNNSFSFKRPKIKKLECDSSCRRCGIKIKNCHYILFEGKELGPYGSECVKKIL